MSVRALVPVNNLSLTTNPTLPTLKVGDSYFNSSDNSYRVYNGTSWLVFGNITVIDGGTP